MDAATLALQRGYEAADGGPAVQTSGPGRSRGRVLVVDDDRAGRTLVRLQLEDLDFEVFVAANGEECLEMAPRLHPEVVLLDIEMPGMDGVETCRRLKGSAETANIPVIFFTGHGESEETTIQALGVGGNDFLSKDAPSPILGARLGSQVAIARAQAKLRRVAMTDELTGVFSRRFMFEALRREVKSAARRKDACVALLLADVDHFKQVNDTFGHLEGDRLLVKLARAIDDCTRETDMVARFGGEQFLVVLPDTACDGAHVVAENVRSVVAQRCSATVSVGVACVAGAVAEELRASIGIDKVIERLVKSADAAMHDAKRLGRNRVLIAPPLTVKN